jgi:hypothetical protein
MALIRIVTIAAGAAAVLYVLDRLLLAAEARGWIYWRRRKASPGTRAGAVMELHALLEPDRKHTAEALREVRHEEDDEGGPGPGGRNGGPRG